MLIVIATPLNAFAAMDAMLTSTHARSGDHVLLLTDDYGGTWNYNLLAAEDRQSIYLAPASDAYGTGACGGDASRLVGELRWRGNSGGVAFIVPNLPAGDYWLFMKTGGQCWRIGGSIAGVHGPLVLSVGTIPADNQEAALRWTVDSLRPSPRPASSPPLTGPARASAAVPWLVMVVLGAAVLLVTSVVWLRVRAHG